MKRFIYAFQMFFLAIRKPQLFQHGMFQTLESLMQFLNDTAEQERPMTSVFGLRCVAKIGWEEKALLTLWCGYAEKDNPLTRLRELAEENAQLRQRLAQTESELIKLKGEEAK